MQDAAANIARIDPAQCRLPPSRLPIAPERCADLAASIRAHGQLVPGLVRRTLPGDPFRYEIVCGARRHFAIIALRQADSANTQPFFAAIRPLSDEAAFAAADRDNRTRADIPDFQRATDYFHALQTYYDGNQDRIARAIHMQPSELSRYLSLASLPHEIFEAFGPANLTIRLARTLFPHLKIPQSHDRIIQTATEISSLQKLRIRAGRAMLPPETVLRRLHHPETPRTAPTTHTVTAPNGRTIATGHRRPDGSIQITIPATQPRDRATLHAAITEILDNLCGTENGWQVPTGSVTAMKRSA
jgi:ParB family chromosome partitioning protein